MTVCLRIFCFTLSFFQILQNTDMTVMADNQYTAQTRVLQLLEFLHERKIEVERLAERKRAKLEQFVQLNQFREDANQVTCLYLKYGIYIWAWIQISTRTKVWMIISQCHCYEQTIIFMSVITYKYRSWNGSSLIRIKKKKIISGRIGITLLTSSTVVLILIKILCKIMTRRKFLWYRSPENDERNSWKWFVELIRTLIMYQYRLWERKWFISFQINENKHWFEWAFHLRRRINDRSFIVSYQNQNSK